MLINDNKYVDRRSMQIRTGSFNGIVKRAAEFAERAHSSEGQLRKYSGEPYIVHPAAVAEIVSSVTDDETVIAAAWLHDVVEDTSVTLEEISAEFGDDVAYLVEALTKVSDGNLVGREKAAKINIAHCGKGDSRAQTIKLADIIHNLSDITETEPSFAEVFVSEKKQLLNVITKGDERLFKRASAMIREVEEKLSSNSNLQN